MSSDTEYISSLRRLGKLLCRESLTAEQQKIFSDYFAYKISHLYRQHHHLEWVSPDDEVPENGQEVLAVNEKEVFFAVYQFGRWLYRNGGDAKVLAWKNIPPYYGVKKRNNN